MADLYNRIRELCNSRHISGYRLCKDTGISPGTLTDLKMGRQSTLNAVNASRIAEYFGVSVAYLLGDDTKKAPTPEGERPISDDDLKFALWGDATEISDEDLDDVRRYAAFVAERKKMREGGK